MKIDYQNSTYTDLLTFAAAAEAAPLIQKAAADGVFRLIGQNAPRSEILRCLSADENEAELLLDILAKCGLILRGKDWLCNAPVADRYLADGAPADPKEADYNAAAFQALCGEAKVTKISAFDGAFVPADDEIIAFWGYYENDYSLVTAIRRWEAYLGHREFPLFSAAKIRDFCKEHHLACTAPISVTSETAVIFAAKSASQLQALTVTPTQKVIAALKKLDFQSVTEISPDEVVVSSWVKDHCRFGCSSYGSKHCPPHSPGYTETQTRLKDYQKALLIEGVPPTHSFQRLMLRAEHIAFKTGFYRAFAYWAGPCSICNECTPPPLPQVCTATRPSMESAGIDVFATVRRQGFRLETRANRNEYVKYFGLLLLD